MNLIRLYFYRILSKTNPIGRMILFGSREYLIVVAYGKISFTSRSWPRVAAVGPPENVLRWDRLVDRQHALGLQLVSHLVGKEQKKYDDVDIFRTNEVYFYGEILLTPYFLLSR